MKIRRRASPATVSVCPNSAIDELLPYTGVTASGRRRRQRRRRVRDQIGDKFASRLGEADCCMACVVGDVSDETACELPGDQ